MTPIDTDSKLTNLKRELAGLVRKQLRLDQSIERLRRQRQDTRQHIERVQARIEAITREE